MLQLLNLLAFLAVAGYAVYLFVNLLYTRVLFVKLGKKAEFEPNLKERISTVLSNALGHKKLFKDKKSGLMHLVLFYLCCFIPQADSALKSPITTVTLSPAFTSPWGS